TRKRPGNRPCRGAGGLGALDRRRFPGRSEPQEGGPGKGSRRPGAARRHTPHARQMLRKLLAGKIATEPVAEGRRRGYRFRGALSIGRLMTGEALQETRETLVTPAGDDRIWMPEFQGVVGTR